ncbi:MAG: hypothetical protein BAJALOKI1v1_430020 [Promethearchaeota archaeon]|nr:MAG: hypothetical protein BAJALOKI1v1_430020 [Candidatus Lokiarchaeota archaeon]
MEASSLPSKSKDLSEVFSKIFSCIDALQAFKDKYDKKLNLDKLFSLLHIPIQERKLYIQLILKFQDLFQDVLNGFELKHIQSQKGSYLKTSKVKNESNKKNQFFQDSAISLKIPHEIYLTKGEANFWNDFIYAFKHVRRGKGFDINKESLETCNIIGKLRKKHPYLFFSNGNELVYPTKFGMELGSKITCYIKVNRQFDEILIDNVRVIIKK